MMEIDIGECSGDREHQCETHGRKEQPALRPIGYLPHEKFADARITEDRENPPARKTTVNPNRIVPSSMIGAFPALGGAAP